MTLRDIINIIKQSALRLPNIHSFYEGDIYKLNTEMDVEYSSVVVTQGQHRVSIEEQEMIYDLYIFFVDRQTDGGENAIDVQSHGIQVLNSIMEDLDRSDLVVGDYTIDVFKERFASLCAGAYAHIQITAPVDVCDNYETT